MFQTPSVWPFSYFWLPGPCMCVRCLCFFGQYVLTVISLSSFSFAPISPCFILFVRGPGCCPGAVMLSYEGWWGYREGTVMSSMRGGAVESAKSGKSCISFWCLDVSFHNISPVRRPCVSPKKREGTAFQKHKRKSSFVSSGKRYSLVGISFHCPRTICLLKQEERRAKIHAEETLRFLRTDSVWICQLFAT